MVRLFGKNEWIRFWQKSLVNEFDTALAQCCVYSQSCNHSTNITSLHWAIRLGLGSDQATVKQVLSTEVTMVCCRLSQQSDGVQCWRLEGSIFSKDNFFRFNSETRNTYFCILTKLQNNIPCHVYCDVNFLYNRGYESNSHIYTLLMASCFHYSNDSLC